MRADLFRLLVLKREGGVYADCDTSPKRRLVDILDKEDQYVTGVGRRSDFHQWLIITVPNHPFIETALRRGGEEHVFHAGDAVDRPRAHAAAKLPPTLGSFRTRSNPTLAQP